MVAKPPDSVMNRLINYLQCSKIIDKALKGRKLLFLLPLPARHAGRGGGIWMGDYTPTLRYAP